MNFYMPVNLCTGENIVSQKKDYICSLGKKCIIVTGAVAAKKSGALDDVVNSLDAGGVKWVLYDKMTQNPTVDSCVEAGILASDSGAEFVIGIGGGSAMDAAKAVAVFASNPSFSESEFYSTSWPVDPLPIVLVGTTAGTGSEVTNVAVLTDSKLRKHSLHDNRMYSRLSLGDPRYTSTLPKSVTLSTGIDVLAHCTESYFCKKANEISRAFSVRGIRRLLPALSAAADDFNLSLEQRGELYEASILGGLAICITGTAFPHNVGYYLTENYHVPHGIACSTFLPDFLNYVEYYDYNMASDFYDQIDSSRDELMEIIYKCLPDLDITMTENEIISALPRWENNNSVKNTVGTFTVDDIEEILKNKFLKG